MTDQEMVALSASVAMELGAGLTDARTKYASHRYQTVRHDNGQDRGHAQRLQGGRLTRFASTVSDGPVPRATAALRHDHPAVVERRTLFPSRVFDAGQMHRVLISGRSNAKLGAFVTVGPWAGFPIYLLSLEERATCPDSCPVFNECMGNGMPSAVRFRYDDALIYQLSDEISQLSRKHPRGFAVRLHVLGDFPDVEYVREWTTWSNRFRQLHVWGYTAHAYESDVGKLIRALNEDRPTRWQVRFSVDPEVVRFPMQAAAVWEKPERTALHDGQLVCPQELGKTQTCGTCGICFKPELSHVRILFLGHGGRGHKSKQKDRAHDTERVGHRQPGTH